MSKPWWAVLASAVLVVGCSSEEQASTEPPGTVSSVSAPDASPDPAANIKPAPDADKNAEPAKTEDAPKAEAPPAAVEAPKDEAPKIEAPKVEPAKKDEAPKGAAAAIKLNDDELAEIKKLPAAEQAAAIAQAVCPVSDEHLGAMGAPIKVSAEGQTFYLCCKGCEDDLKSDPKAVVAKLAVKK